MQNVNMNSMEKVQEEINDNNEYSRQRLKRILGESNAEYFTNTNIGAKKIEEKFTNKSNQSKFKIDGHAGLFADSIRKIIEAEQKSRNERYELNKQLQKTMDSFVRNEVYHKRDRVHDSVRNEDELFRAKKTLDMNRIKQIKALRNEVELMYRSSKLNEEKAAVLRHLDSPFPDLNDRNGTESSIQRYLPPIDSHKHSSASNLKQKQQNSALEFLYAGHMRERYREKLERKMLEQNHTLEAYDILKNKQVKMLFLKENEAVEQKPSVDANYEGMLVLARAIDESRNSEETIKFETSFQEQEKQLPELNYPPLTLNALMEYRQTVEAPGRGPFEQGKQKLFKL